MEEIKVTYSLHHYNLKVFPEYKAGPTWPQTVFTKVAGHLILVKVTPAGLCPCTGSWALSKKFTAMYSDHHARSGELQCPRNMQCWGTPVLKQVRHWPISISPVHAKLKALSERESISNPQRCCSHQRREKIPPELHTYPSISYRKFKPHYHLIGQLSIYWLTETSLTEAHDCIHIVFFYEIGNMFYVCSFPILDFKNMWVFFFLCVFPMVRGKRWMGRF